MAIWKIDAFKLGNILFLMERQHDQKHSILDLAKFWFSFESLLYDRYKVGIKKWHMVPYNLNPFLARFESKLVDVIIHWHITKEFFLSQCGVIIKKQGILIEGNLWWYRNNKIPSQKIPTINLIKRQLRLIIPMRDQSLKIL